MEQSLWAAVPAYMRKLNSALKKHTDRELPIGCAPLTFGSWMGGDRDGNPNVTAQVGSKSVIRPITLDSGHFLIRLLWSFKSLIHSCARHKDDAWPMI